MPLRIRVPPRRRSISAGHISPSQFAIIINASRTRGSPQLEPYRGMIDIPDWLFRPSHRGSVDQSRLSSDSTRDRRDKSIPPRDTATFVHETFVVRYLLQRSIVTVVLPSRLRVFFHRHRSVKRDPPRRTEVHSRIEVKTVLITTAKNSRSDQRLGRLINFQRSRSAAADVQSAHRSTGECRPSQKMGSVPGDNAPCEGQKRRLLISGDAFDDHRCSFHRLRDRCFHQRLRFNGHDHVSRCKTRVFLQFVVRWSFRAREIERTLNSRSRKRTSSFLQKQNETKLGFLTDFLRVLVLQYLFRLAKRIFLVSSNNAGRKIKRDRGFSEIFCRCLNSDVFRVLLWKGS